MAIEIKAPTLGESVSEIYVGKWYKSPGDPIAKDEPLVELESDKATIDLPSADSGRLTEILKPSGSTVEVGEVIAMFEPGKIEKDSSPEPTTSEASETTQSKSKVRDSVDGTTKKDKSDEPKPTFSYSDISGPVAEVAEPVVESREIGENVSHDQESTDTSPPLSVLSEPGAKETENSTPDRVIERVPISPLRRRIALRLVEAQQNTALLTTFNEADMTEVKRLRTEFVEAFEKKHGVRLGFMGFFVKATVAALEQFPKLNAIIDENDIVYRRFHDIGIAVSTEKGLVVPVLRNVERMSIAMVERSIDEYAKLARSGDLKVEDLRGGTFTITNGGVFGSLLSTPIINPPQSGVLGMHAIQDRPVVRNGEIVIRPMMYLALTYDHRIVDGREAVLFLAQIKHAIENPSRLLLDI